MANYQILNYKGEELIASVSDAELATMKENTMEFNCFEWDGNEETHVVKGFAAQMAADPEMTLENVRIYKLIEEEA